MAFYAAAPLFKVLSLVIITSALAEGDSCRCSPYLKGNGGRVCSDGTAPSEDQTYARHNFWGLHGDCLPEVEANTMKCFRWSTLACSKVPDLCEYSSRSKFNSDININHDNSISLFSPKHDNLVNRVPEDQSFGHHFFCVYNVSLSCQQESVIIESTAKTNWPAHQDTSCQQSEGGCENYVAFYDDRNSKIISREFYGQKNYRHSLNSDSFLAVMWTNRLRNKGIFEFKARCNDQEAFMPVTSTGEEGSGDEKILSPQES